MAFYYCIIDYHKFRKKTACIYYLIVSVGLGSGQAYLDLFASGLCKSHQELQFHLKVPLEKDLLPNSWIFQALCSFSSYKWGIHLLVDFQLGPTSVPCHMGVSTMTSKGKSLLSRWALQFYVIEWRKWHCHLCCVLLAKTSLRSQLEKRGDCTRAGDCVHHLRACPSQMTSLKLLYFFILFSLLSFQSYIFYFKFHHNFNFY